METGKRGAWTSIPRKPHTLNSLREHEDTRVVLVVLGSCYLSGTEMRYSWKKAEVKKTMSVAVMRELPEESSGLYRCRTHHLHHTTSTAGEIIR